MPDTALSYQIWNRKYRARRDGQPLDASLEASWRRVAKALASVEPDNHRAWEARFYQQLQGFRFLPGGRILAGAGTSQRATLFNCFAMGPIRDSVDGIFDALKEGAVTMQQGGGVGYDFSTLRPRGWPAKSVGASASGPVSFMEVWDVACATLLATGTRRGAMMATLRCDHPDIERFITAKTKPGQLTNFNLSVLVSDAFLDAVERDAPWPLLFPVEPGATGDAGEPARVLYRAWFDSAQPVPCRVVEVVKARRLWEQLMMASYDTAEPGVLFIDRINRYNNLRYRERISTTNPCGEIPLPANGACDLGSINLTRFVLRPFSDTAALDIKGLQETTRVAVRMLDNVIDLSPFPLAAQREQAKGARRIGLGITGLGDSLMMLGLGYGEPAARGLAAGVMRTVAHCAYRASVELGREKGVFPYFDRERYLESPFIRSLPADIQRAVGRQGPRNSHLIAIAPAGTISLLAGNVSSGIEPVFDLDCSRRFRDDTGGYREQRVVDYAAALWGELKGGLPYPPSFVTARQLDPRQHLAMQACLQPYVDNSISKTINIPFDYGYASYQGLFIQAARLGLKGCTCFRANPVSGAVLSTLADERPCCGADRSEE